ncbi:dTMP kinase [Candidatus Dependentiae bacterium]|nr:dTMP kinase [Candidatus Dependentiae bacterium]
MNKLQKGILISIEGIDGSGKSTLANSLYENLKELKYDVVLTKEPGSTKLGKNLRQILHERDFDLTCKSEFLLFAADRAQHFQDIIIPALTAKKIVISDRLSDSSIAYQGYGRGLDVNMLAAINSWAMQGVNPDFTLYLKIDYETAIARLMKTRDNLTSFEKEQSFFFYKVIDGFEKIFKNRLNVYEIDAKNDKDVLLNYALNIILKQISYGQLYSSCATLGCKSGQTCC